MTDLEANHGTRPAIGPTATDPPETDPVALLDDVPLTSAEAEYDEAARAANTLRG